MDAVGEQDDEEVAVGIHPYRRAREPGVAEGAGTEERPRRRVLARGVPSERAARVGHARALREALHRLPRDDALVLEDAAAYEHLREAGEVGSGAEEAGVRRDAAQGGRVLVVHLAAQDVAAPGIVLGGRGTLQ